MWQRLERREISRLRGPAPDAESPLDALDLDAAPAFATPPVLPAPTLRWGTWTP
jgi:hypothetical protein